MITAPGLRIWDRTDAGEPATEGIVSELLHCPVRFAVEVAAGPSIDWMTKCVRPPFDTLWLEYPHLEMLCGALINSIDNDGGRFEIHFVTCSRVDGTAPLWWPGPEIVELTAGGSLAHRQAAISDSRNNVGQVQIPTLTSVFNAVYHHLALIHEVRRRGLLPRTNTATPLLPARSHALDGAVVLMWGDATPSRRSSTAADPRHAPTGHQVRGHQRRLGDGETTWVRPHRRGAETDGAADTPSTYKIKKRGGGQDR